MSWTPGPWKVRASGRLISSDEQEIVASLYWGNFEADGRLIVCAPELAEALEEVTGWLEGTEAFEQNHGAHSAAVEARKLLARARGED